ncbi:MAG: hypothetical protein AAB402_01085 [Patescibacteria group bacterium]
MKSRKNLIEQLKPLPHFGKNTVYQLGKQLGLTDATINTYISRGLKHNEIVQLRNGLYVAADFYDKNKNDISYSFYLANVIRTPSYVSSWAALQYYDLTTETIHSVTSVTPKVTREYKTRVGNFAYQSIQKSLFTDFSLAKAKFDCFVASPSKALFDLLYFRTNQFRRPALGKIETLIENLRIDFDQMDKSEQEKFHAMIKKYLHE